MVCVMSGWMKRIVSNGICSDLLIAGRGCVPPQSQRDPRAGSISLGSTICPSYALSAAPLCTLLTFVVLAAAQPL